MKKLLIFTLVGVLFFSLTSISLAAKKVKVKEKELTLTEQMDAKKQELNGTEYTLNIKGTGEEAVAETDVITLSEGKFVSQNLSNAGFLPSSFSVRFKGNKTLVETMQKTEAGEMAMWRMDIDEEEGTISGAMSRTDLEGKTYEFYF
ncbi:MAG: hypothetical protein ABH848_04755 [Candidatus Omnitrophota bacterium]